MTYKESPRPAPGALAHTAGCFAGDWDRGLEIFNQTARLVAQQPGWFHFLPFVIYFRRGEFEQAWQALMRVNLPENRMSLLATAMTAARLGRANDVRTAIAPIRRVAPEHLDLDAARQQLTKMLWADESILEAQVSAYQEALRIAAADSETAPVASARDTGPSSVAVLPFANLSADPENE